MGLLFLFEQLDATEEMSVSVCQTVDYSLYAEDVLVKSIFVVPGADGSVAGGSDKLEEILMV